jgi:preprotein translocase subunit SecF
MKLWFFNKTRFFMILSSVIILAGLITGFAFGGLNLGIDFTGGSIFTIEMGSSFTDQDINAALTANGVDPAKAQIVHATKTVTGDEAVVRMQQLPYDTDMKALRESIVDSLKEKYPNVAPGEIENIAGTTSSEIIANAFLSVVIASVLMLIYIWIRFALYSGIAAVIALLHDVLIMTAFVSITRIQINSPYIAACLTILGYSINDTIVVFDRIRENNKRYGAKEMSRAQIADRSIVETMPRTINTSLTTLITITAVYIFGVPSIKEFSLPLIIGLASGTYSSIFIASPIWVWLENRRDKRLHYKSTLQKSKA